MYKSNIASDRAIPPPDRQFPTPQASQIEETKFPEVIYSQAPEEALQTSLIQKLFGEYHHWTLHSREEELPDDIDQSRQQLITEFINGFFLFDKACSPQLKVFAGEFIEKLKEFILNLPFTAEEFCEKMINEYNIFHYRNSSLQNETTLEIISSVKKSFIINQIVKRSIRSDLSLHEQEQIFLGKMFEARIFNSKMFLHYYLKYLKCFIEGYSPDTEKEIKDTVERFMQNYCEQLSGTLDETSIKVNSYISELLNKINYVRNSVYLSQLSFTGKDGQEVVYEFFAHKEEVCLQQVVQLSPEHVLITINLVQSKNFIIISYNIYTTTRLSHPFIDDKIVIASGSTVDSIIIFQNTKRMVEVACMGLDSIIVKRQIDIYRSAIIGSVISACYIQVNDEVLFINDNGHIQQFCLKRKGTLTSLKQVAPTSYRKIIMTDSNRFIILLSKFDLFLFSFQMELVYQGSCFPHTADFKDKELDIIFFENSADIIVKSIPITLEHMVENRYSGNFLEKINAKLLNTRKSAKGMIKGVFRNRSFRGVSVPYVKPK